MREDNKRQLIQAFALASGIGLQIVASVIVGILLGRWADSSFDTFPWGTMSGIVLGMAAGLWSVYKKIMEK